MSENSRDESAGDADYGVIGQSYISYRQPDPRIAAAVNSALGDVRTVVNVGVGAGSYEPTDRDVTAVEPSRTMREQRPSQIGLDIGPKALLFPIRAPSGDTRNTKDAAENRRANGGWKR